jgi:hypothetical protein
MFGVGLARLGDGTDQTLWAIVTLLVFAGPALDAVRTKKDGGVRAFWWSLAIGVIVSAITLLALNGAELISLPSWLATTWIALLVIAGASLLFGPMAYYMARALFGH